jgi:flagellar biogenesis protein FliO
MKAELHIEPGESGAVNSMSTTTPQLLVTTLGMRVAALWERIVRLSRRTPKRLRLCESLPLGERRFVAVVEFEAARFLVGGTPSSMVLLSRLADVGDAVPAGRAVASGSETAAMAVGPKLRGERC